ESADCPNLAALASLSVPAMAPLVEVRAPAPERVEFQADLHSNADTRFGEIVSRTLRMTQSPLFFGLGLGTLLLAGAAVGLFAYFNNRPGELVVTSEPSMNVQVLLDNKPMATGTPVTFGQLRPGSYVLTLNREGFVPAHRTV